MEVNNHISDLKQHQGYGMHTVASTDVLEIIPVQLLFDDTFYQYLASHNEKMLKLQAHTLLKLEKYFLEPEVNFTYSRALTVIVACTCRCFQEITCRKSLKWEYLNF